MPEYNFYVLAYFDLLGQSELLDSLTDEFILSCAASATKENLIEKMKPTFGRVMDFRNHLRKVVSDINCPIELPSDLKGKVTELKWKKLTDAKVDVEFMGDAALLKVCIKNNPNGPLPIVSIKNLLDSIGMQMLFFLGGRIPVRGAIEIGWGTHIEENSIYGTMLHRAFRLEKEAGYPRIVVGQNFVNYIQMQASIRPESIPDEGEKIIVAKAQDIMSSILEDEDGQLVLNYLRKELYSANEETFNEVIKNAKLFIQSELSSRRCRREIKLINNYRRLRQFFQKNGAF